MGDLGERVAPPIAARWGRFRGELDRRTRASAGAIAQRFQGADSAPDPAHWQLDIDVDGRLSRRGVPLAALTGEFGSPLHVVDGPTIDRLAKAHQESVGDARTWVSYGQVSVRLVLERLHRVGVDAVVGSLHELELADLLGLGPERVIFAEPAPTAATLRQVVRRRTRAIIVSSSGLVERCAEAVALTHEMLPSDEIPVGVSIELDGTVNEAGVAAVGQWHAAVAASAGLRPSMLRMVVRLPLCSLDAATTTGAMVAAILRQIAVTTGWTPPELLLSVETLAPTTRSIAPLEARLNQTLATTLRHPDRAATHPHEITRALASSVRSAGCTSDLHVEPGASLTAQSAMLLTTVLDVKRDRAPWHAILDAGINLATCTLGEYHELLNTSCAIGPAGRAVRFAGPICTPADVLYANWKLPRVDVDDVVAIMDTGARFVSESTSFSFPQPAVVVHDKNGIVIARKAETFERLISLDEMPPSEETSNRGCHET